MDILEYAKQHPPIELTDMLLLAIYEKLEEISKPKEIKLENSVQEYKPNYENMSRPELVKLAKELGIQGKLVTFSTEDLKNKIKEGV